MSELAVSLDGVGKMYKIFSSRTANLKDALGLPSIRRGRYSQFWAVRDIDLTLGRGERLGVIGRNGAGKSTILKLITQNLAPTEGTVTVNGQVQALLETGGGLHPEFTGLENIDASLTFLGLSQEEIRAAHDDIAEFTELGRFLSQPFKTYSTGMQARLAFGIATTIQPEILIVDEILGAGDAYFFGKSIARMQRLLQSGASVLLVSHALDQVIRFCDEAIWLDRGQIVMRGPSTEIVKAYERFIRQLDDQRLRARNLKTASGRFDAFDRDTYTDQFIVEVEAAGAMPIEVSQVSLLRDGEAENRVVVGAPQDADASQSAAIVAATGWTEPQLGASVPHRSVPAGASARALFHLWFLYGTSSYDVEIAYRAPSGGRLRVLNGDETVGERELPPVTDVTVERLRLTGTGTDESDRSAAAKPAAPSISRWPGEGTFLIEDVRLLDEMGLSQAIFEAGSPLAIVIRARTSETGRFPVIPAATIYRADGVLVTNLVGEPFDVDAVEGGCIEFRLEYGPLNLGNDRYSISVALYRTLSHVELSEAYDLLDRSYEFEVQGNEPFDNGIFRHVPEWHVERVEPVAPRTEQATT